MTLSAMKFSRTRLLAMLLVAVFSFAAMGATALAADASAATKKSKKCKKNYKKSKGKCKKSKGTKGKAFVSALGVAAAPDASAAKKKKCKKGYKRTNGKGKCKKKKAATSTKVSSVTLRITDSNIYFYEFAGEVIVKSPLASIPVKVTATKGSFDVSSEVTATGDGTTTTLTFSGKVKNPITYPGLSKPDSRKPTTFVAVSDGISSASVKP